MFSRFSRIGWQRAQQAASILQVIPEKHSSRQTFAICKQMAPDPYPLASAGSSQWFQVRDLRWKVYVA